MGMGVVYFASQGYQLPEVCNSCRHPQPLPPRRPQLPSVLGWRVRYEWDSCMFRINSEDHERAAHAPACRRWLQKHMSVVGQVGDVAKVDVKVWSCTAAVKRIWAPRAVQHQLEAQELLQMSCANPGGDWDVRLT